MEKRGGFKWETEINCAFSRMHGLNDSSFYLQNLTTKNMINENCDGNSMEKLY